MTELTRGQKRSEYQKLYREAHREQKQEYEKQYWILHKQEISEKRNKQVTCNICGSKYPLQHKADHERRTYHQEALNNTNTQDN